MFSHLVLYALWKIELSLSFICCAVSQRMTVTENVCKCVCLNISHRYSQGERDFWCWLQGKKFNYSSTRFFLLLLTVKFLLCRGEHYWINSHRSVVLCERADGQTHSHKKKKINKKQNQKKKYQPTTVFLYYKRRKCKIEKIITRGRNKTKFTIFFGK